MPRHTIRGLLGAGESERLILDDGIYTHGHVVKSFHIIGANNGDTGAIAILSRGATSPAIIDFSDSQQIAWTIWDNDTTFGNRMVPVIDPDHVVQQDLWIHGLTGACNYLIEIMPIEMTDAQGVLQLVKAKRQG